MPQMGFLDLSDRYASLDAKKDPLVEINAVVTWEEFRSALERVWRKPDEDRKSRAGRKPADAVLMFRTLVLSALCNLSDDQIEYQVRDRLSFMRFLGLGLGDRVPDAKTVWLDREALAQSGKMEEMFALFDGHRARRGCIARGGQILDASIVPVPRNHNRRAENVAIKAGETPEGWADEPAKRSQKDVDARWSEEDQKTVRGTVFPTNKHGNLQCNKLWTPFSGQMTRPEIPSPPRQQRPRNLVTPRRRRTLPVTPEAFLDDPHLRSIRPVSPTTLVDNRKHLNLRSELSRLP